MTPLYRFKHHFPVMIIRMIPTTIIIPPANIGIQANQPTIGTPVTITPTVKHSPKMKTKIPMPKKAYPVIFIFSATSSNPQ